MTLRKIGFLGIILFCAFSTRQSFAVEIKIEPMPENEGVGIENQVTQVSALIERPSQNDQDNIRQQAKDAQDAADLAHHETVLRNFSRVR